MKKVMNWIREKKTIIGLVVVGIVGFVGIVVLPGLYTGDDEKPKPLPTISLKSSTNTVEAIMKSRMKGEPEGAPEIIWQHPETGESASEVVIFTNQGAKTDKAKDALRKLLRKEGFRRVWEYCTGLTEKTLRWSVGYCTYRNAPVALKG